MKFLSAAIVFCLFIISSVFIFFRQTQSVFYTSDIAPIIKTNCQTCHYANGPGGFSLAGYQNAVRYASKIKAVVENGYMPPWKADPTYRHFAGERILSEKEKQLITTWVKQGMPEGEQLRTLSDIEPTNTTARHEYISLTTPEQICIDPGVHDAYVSYPFFLNNRSELNIENFVLVPGNKKILHHAWLFVMTRHEAYNMFPEWKKSVSVTVRKELDSPMGKHDMLGNLLYLPGSANLLSIKGQSKKFPADAVLVVDLHYFNKSDTAECDRPSLKIYTQKETKTREIFFAVLDESSLPQFHIPPDTVIGFALHSPPLEDSYSVVKVTPHMHYLGKSMEAFAVTPQNDTINLVRINTWDFNWQETYSFSPLVVLPKGTVICMRGVYDNTSGNTNNPNIPPVAVYQGFRSRDEMFQLGLEYILYQNGDEFLKPE